MAKPRNDGELRPVQPSLYDDEEVGAVAPPPRRRRAHTRTGDPASSHQAETVAERAANINQARTLWCYQAAATDDEAVLKTDALPGGRWLHGTMAKRRLRLEDKDWIVAVRDPDGKVTHRKTSHGVEAMVFELSDEGKRVLKEYLDKLAAQ